jgi:hypothetical protein
VSFQEFSFFTKKLTAFDPVNLLIFLVVVCVEPIHFDAENNAGSRPRLPETFFDPNLLSEPVALDLT